MHKELYQTLVHQDLIILQVKIKGDPRIEVFERFSLDIVYSKI